MSRRFKKIVATPNGHLVMVRVTSRSYNSNVTGKTRVHESEAMASHIACAGEGWAAHVRERIESTIAWGQDQDSAYHY